MRRNYLCSLFFGVASIVAFSGAALADPPLHYSGSVDIDQTRVSFLVSGNGGGGALHFRGRIYPFSIGGLGIGGIGITKLVATGSVYNLPSASSFPGTYTEMRTGFALGDVGRGKLWLKNGRGVVLKLQGEGKGVGLSLGADAVAISYK
jgi:hypothetical protein